MMYLRNVKKIIVLSNYQLSTFCGYTISQSNLTKPIEMEYYNVYFLMTILTSTMICQASGAINVRTRDEYIRCMSAMRNYCHQLDDSRLTSLSCAKSLVYYWKQDKSVHHLIEPYHYELLRNIYFNDNIRLQEDFCNNQEPDHHDNDIEAMPIEEMDKDKCLSDLAKFGGTKFHIFQYALIQTNVYKEDKIDVKSYAVNYVVEISNNTILRRPVIHPQEYCYYQP